MFYITGDTHIPIDIEKLDEWNFPEQYELTKADYLIICGDFGGIWSNDTRHTNCLDMLESANFTTLWIDGNHENFDKLSVYPIKEWNGGNIQYIRPSVIHLMRGQVYEIDKLKFFTMGGGYSIDKHYRIPGLSWWKQEMPNQEEYAEALANLKKHGNTVDYIITHTSKTSIVKHYYVLNINEEKELNDFFEKLDTFVEYKHWYCGHIHEDVDFDDKHTLLFNRVLELK